MEFFSSKFAAYNLTKKRIHQGAVIWKLLKSNFWREVLFLLRIYDILEVFLIKLLRQLPWRRE